MSLGHVWQCSCAGAWAGGRSYIENAGTKQLQSPSGLCPWFLLSQDSETLWKSGKEHVRGMESLMFMTQKCPDQGGALWGDDLVMRGNKSKSLEAEVWNGSHQRGFSEMWKWTHGRFCNTPLSLPSSHVCSQSLPVPLSHPVLPPIFH
jgi:hypothetical protein